jgi:hypothetical protein
MSEQMNTNPRQVKLKRCSVWSPLLSARATNAIDRGIVDREGIDISANVLSIDIYESIFQNTISARLEIRETHGYVEYFPLTGTEFIDLQYSVIYESKERTYRRLFRVQRIIDQSFPKNEERSYTIELVTPEFFNSVSSRITKKFKDITCVDAVKEIMKEHLKVPDSKLNEAVYETTVGTIDVVIPNYTPLQAINFLSLLSLTATQNPESNFVFFETMDGFYFTSIRKLIADGKKAAKDYDAAGGTNWRNTLTLNYDPNKPPKAIPKFVVSANKMTGSPKISDREAYNSIIGLHQDEVFDSLKDAVSGMLRSKMLHLDFFGRKWNEEDSRYTQTFKKTTHLDDYPVYPENFDQSVSRNVKLFIVPTNTTVAKSQYVAKAGEQITQQRMYESIVLRNRQMKEIQHMRTLIEVPGQPDLRAGSVVQVVYPSSRAIQGASDNPSMGNIPQSPTPFHSGLHLVTHVRHTLTQVSRGVMDYRMHIEATRDSFGAPMAKYEEKTTDVDGKAN